MSVQSTGLRKRLRVRQLLHMELPRPLPHNTYTVDCEYDNVFLIPLRSHTDGSEPRRICMLVPQCECPASALVQPNGLQAPWCSCPRRHQAKRKRFGGIGRTGSAEPEARLGAIGRTGSTSAPSDEPEAHAATIVGRTGNRRQVGNATKTGPHTDKRAASSSRLRPMFVIPLLRTSSRNSLTMSRLALPGFSFAITNLSL